MTGDKTAVPPVPQLDAPPPAARSLFGDRLDAAVAYAQLLAREGTVRGLIGPREIGRLWERHLLNSAVLADLLPERARVVDIGSGAGLPGLPLAIRRPDLRVDLVEPMQRRVAFLTEAVEALGLGGSVRVVHGRAEDRPVRDAVGNSDWVTARAVAPLDRLVRWCLPLLSPGGTLLALKGASATDEVGRCGAAMRRYGASAVEVRQLGVGLLEAPTWVVLVRRGAGAEGTTRGGA